MVVVVGEDGSDAGGGKLLVLVVELLMLVEVC